MNCTNLHTAAEVLEAFRACNNAGEQIELFECLATRPDPPVEALVELLRSVKLEPVLALTIQAFGKIINADIKARLKQSDDLLEVLSRQAQSGSNDLIRWSAATAIEEMGFDFLMVAQYLSQDPRDIARSIEQSKVQSLLNCQDFNEFTRSWIYWPLDKLSSNVTNLIFSKSRSLAWRCEHTLTGHSHKVFSVAISPNKQTIVSGSQDQTVKVWDIRTGRLLNNFSEHTNTVKALAFSSDGQSLLSGSDDKKIMIWNLATGKLIRTLSTGESVWSVATRGHLIASDSFDGRVKLWNLDTGELYGNLCTHSSIGMSLAITPNNSTIAISDKESIHLVSLKTGDLIHTFSGHSQMVSSIDISSDNQILASGSFDKTIKLWDMHTKSLLHTFTGHSASVWSVSIGADGRTLASGSDDGLINLWCLNTGKLLRTLSGHSRSVRSVAISNDGHLLASGSDDNTVKIWQCH